MEHSNYGAFAEDTQPMPAEACTELEAEFEQSRRKLGRWVWVLLGLVGLLAVFCLSPLLPVRD